jgi:hypothetical protein
MACCHPIINVTDGKNVCVLCKKVFEKSEIDELYDN